MQINLFYSATARDPNTITITTQLLDALVGRHGGQGGSSTVGERQHVHKLKEQHWCTVELPQG